MADELRTVLGFDASQAIATVKQLTVALDSYTNSISRAASATSKFNTSAKPATASLNQVSASLGKVPGASNTAGQSLDKLAKRVDGVRKPTRALAKDTKEAAGSVLISWQSIVRIGALQVVHQAISGLKSSISDAIAESRSFIKELSQIQTISGDTFSNINSLADEIQEFSAATGQPLSAVTKGIYQTLTNQVTDAANSFNFLQTASDFSISAITDLNSSVNLLSSVINAYNMNASSAADVSGKLFKAIEVGRFVGQEIADTFGRVAGLSSQLGASFEEVLASMATLTRTGMKYNEAYTLITNVQLKLIKPTKELSNRFKEMGVSSAEAGIQAYGFQGFLMKISEGAGETASELAQLYGRVRAVRGALGLGADYAEVYADSLEKIRSAGRDTLAEKKALIFETNARQVEIELNKLHIAMVNFGRGATDVSHVIMNQFGGATNTVKTLTTAVLAGGTAWLVARTNVIAASTSIIQKLISIHKTTGLLNASWKALASSPLFWAAAAAGAVAAVSWALNKAINDVKNTKKEMEKALTIGGKLELIDYEAELNATVDHNKAVLGEVQKLLFERQRLFNEHFKGIEFNQELLVDSLTSQLEGHISAVTGLFDSFKEKAGEISSELKTIDQDTASIRTNIADWKFDRSLRGLNAIEESYKRVNKSQQLLRQASAALSRGDIESAKALQQRAESQAKNAVSLADQSKDYSAITKAENQAIAAMEMQVSINEQNKVQLQNQLDILNRHAHMFDMISLSIEKAGEKYSELADRLKEATDPVDRERIMEQMASIAKDIESIKPKIQVYAQLANITGLQDEFEAAIKGIFDPLTGEAASMEEVMGNTIARIKSLFGDLQSVVEQQKIGVLLGKQLDEGKTALLRQKEAQTELDSAIKLTSVDMEHFLRSWTKWNLLARPVGTTEDVKTMRTEMQETANQIHIAVQEANKLAAAGESNSSAFADQLAKIREIRNTLAEQFPGGIFGIGKPEETLQSLDAMIERFITMSEKQKEISKESEAADPAKALMEQLKNAADPVQEALRIIEEAARNSGQSIGNELTSGANTAASAMQSSASTQISSLKAVEQQAWATARAIAAASSGGGAVAASRGGPIYRAEGGFTPRGTDTIPAMLSPGEFVVNAQSTRKFFSQLVAMNSGKQPVFRQSGGPVGDINISINESQSPKSTAREIATLIRREMQRNTIRKF